MDGHYDDADKLFAGLTPSLDDADPDKTEVVAKPKAFSDIDFSIDEKGMYGKDALDFYDRDPGDMSIEEQMKLAEMRDHFRQQVAPEPKKSEKETKVLSIEDDDFISSLGEEVRAGKKKGFFEYSALQYTAETGKKVDTETGESALKLLSGSLRMFKDNKDNEITGRIAAGEKLHDFGVKSGLTRYHDFDRLDLASQDNYLKKAPELFKATKEWERELDDSGMTASMSDNDFHRERTKFIKERAKEIMGERQRNREFAASQLEDTPWSLGRTASMGLSTMGYGGEFALGRFIGGGKLTSLATGGAMGGPVGAVAGQFIVPMVLATLNKHSELSTPVFDVDGNVVAEADDPITAFRKATIHGAYETGTEMIGGEIFAWGMGKALKPLSGPAKDLIINLTSNSTGAGAARAMRAAQKIITGVNAIESYTAWSGWLPEVFEEFIQQPFEESFAIKESLKQGTAFDRLWNSAANFDFWETAEGFVLNEVVHKLIGFGTGGKQRQYISAARSNLKNLKMNPTAVDLMTDRQVLEVQHATFTGNMGNALADALEGAGNRITAEAHKMANLLNTDEATKGKVANVEAAWNALMEGETRGYTEDGQVEITNMDKDRADREAVAAEIKDSLDEIVEAGDPGYFLGVGMTVDEFLDVAEAADAIKEAREKRRKELEKNPYAIKPKTSGYMIKDTRGQFPAIYAPNEALARKAAEKMHRLTQARDEILDKRAEVAEQLAQYTMAKGTNVIFVDNDKDAKRVIKDNTAFRTKNNIPIAWDAGAHGLTSPDKKHVIINLGAIRSIESLVHTMKHEGMHTLDLGWTKVDLQNLIDKLKLRMPDGEPATAEALIKNMVEYRERRGHPISDEGVIISEILAELQESVMGHVEYKLFGDWLKGRLVNLEKVDGTKLTPEEKRIVQARLLEPDHRSVKIDNQMRKAFEQPADEQIAKEAEQELKESGAMPAEAEATPSITPEQAEGVKSVGDLTAGMVQALSEKGYSTDDLQKMTPEQLQAAMQEVVAEQQQAPAEQQQEEQAEEATPEPEAEEKQPEVAETPKKTAPEQAQAEAEPEPDVAPAPEAPPQKQAVEPSTGVLAWNALTEPQQTALENNGVFEEDYSLMPEDARIEAIREALDTYGSEAELAEFNKLHPEAERKVQKEARKEEKGKSAKEPEIAPLTEEKPEKQPILESKEPKSAPSEGAERKSVQKEEGWIPKITPEAKAEINRLWGEIMDVDADKENLAKQQKDREDKQKIQEGLERRLTGNAGDMTPSLLGLEPDNPYLWDVPAKQEAPITKNPKWSELTAVQKKAVSAVVKGMVEEDIKYRKERGGVARINGEYTVTAKVRGKFRELAIERLFGVERHRLLTQEQRDAADRGEDPYATKKPEAKGGEKPESKATTKKIEENPDKIDDFGKKLYGAKKDKTVWEKNLTRRDMAKYTLSQLWPKSEVDSIEDPLIAAFGAVLRAHVPNKGNTANSINRWVNSVSDGRQMMERIREIDPNEMLKAIEGANESLARVTPIIRLLSKIDRKEWGRIKIKDSAWYPNAYTYKDGERIAKPYGRVVIDGKSELFETPNFDDFVNAVKNRLHTSEAVDKNAPKILQFELMQYKDSGKLFIRRKGDALHRTLVELADGTTVAEARKYLKENLKELADKWREIKERDNVSERDLRRDENRPRSAVDYRKGEDVTPEHFQDTFGFRGVEFGNWVAQGANSKERQGMLNQAYDALMDLAGILNVPPRAITFDGQLGLAMGSRGAGWASAHYEPKNIVINLTKTRGAGSLAHEWFHALDHYFQRQRNESGIRVREGDYITQSPETYYENANGERISEKRFNEIKARGGIRNADTWQRVEGVRVEVATAFADLVKRLNESPMAKRSEILAKGQAGYWSQVIERAARSFESYVIDKMAQQGYHNDYLANVVSAKEFSRNLEHYPYLLESELQPVVEAFDNLFNTIQTRTTETGGEAMFKLSSEIEETKDLVALHNLSEGNLRFVLGMGGDLVFPSIAITKKGVPFDGFGDISIIFPKSTIDPRTSRANRIYGSDAYTVRFPTVNYDIDKGVLRNINQRLYDALGKKAPMLDEMRFNSEFRGSAGDAKSAFYNQQYVKDTYKHEREKKLTELKYDEWFDDFFKGVIKGTGIRNEADLIAPSGTRRSFAATHVPVTTANVLRAMKKDAGAGGEGYNYGFPNFIAKMSKKIGTIRHLKEESRRLKKIDDNEMRDIERGLEKTYDGIIQDVYSRGEERDGYFTESDLISDWLVKSYAHTPEATRERANNTRGGRYQMTLENAKDLHSLVKSIRELPRSYFEAKPQRAVPLSEGLAFVVPKGTPKTLTDAIRRQGGKVYRYDGAENRVEVVNKAAQEQNAMFMLAGERAKTAPSLVEAEEMEKAKAGKIKIWKDTGWWRGYDGKWRFEIDPSEIKWRNRGDSISILSNVKTATIGDVIEFDKLFAAYPEIKNYSIELRSAYDKRTSTMDFKPATNEFSVKSGIQVNEFRSALVHELQHAVQYIEEYSVGGSWREWLVEYNKLYRVLSKPLFNKAASSLMEHGKFPVPLEKVMEVKKQFPEEYKELSDVLSHFKTGNIQEVREKVEDIMRDADPFNKYSRLGGEAESRLVQYRLDMTPEQRKNIPPWVSMEKMLKEEGLLKDGQKVEDVLLGLDRKAEDLARTFETDPTMQGADGFVQGFTQDAMFKLSDKKRDEYTEMLNKAWTKIDKQRGFTKPTFKDADIKAQLDAIADYDDPKKQAIAVHWLRNKSIILPEDQYKVDDAYNLAQKKSIDMFKYDNPMSLLNDNGAFATIKGRDLIDPDGVKYLSNKRELGHGVVIYDVDNSRASQLAIRQMMNKQAGNDWNPWCLLQSNGREGVSSQAIGYWDKTYNALPKQIAIKGGEIVGFMASSKKDITWWDENDKPSGGIKLEELPVPNDALNRKYDAVLNTEDGGVTAPGNGDILYREDNVNKIREEWKILEPDKLNDAPLISRITYPNGKDNRTEVWYNKNGDAHTIEKYKNGRKDLQLEYVGKKLDKGYSKGNIHREFTIDFDEDGDVSGIHLNKNGSSIKAIWLRGSGRYSNLETKDGVVSKSLYAGSYDHQWSYTQSVNNHQTHSIIGNGDAAVITNFKKGTIRVDHNGNVIAIGEHAFNTEGKMIASAREEFKKRIAEGNAPNISEFELPESPDIIKEIMEWEQDTKARIKKEGQKIREEFGMKFVRKTEAEQLSLTTQADPTESQNAMFKLEDDPATLKKLESGETFKAYRSMQMEDGKLYPFKGRFFDGKEAESSQLGKWERAVENPHLADDKGRIDLKSNVGWQNVPVAKVAYAPYLHARENPLNIQFSAAWRVPQAVVMEVEVPVSEMGGTYQAEKSLRATGKHDWSGGDYAGLLDKGDEGQVSLSRWHKPVRVLSHAEVAESILPLVKKIEGRIEGNKVGISYFQPQLRAELEARGVEFYDNINIANTPANRKAREAYDKAYQEAKAEIASRGVQAGQEAMFKLSKPKQGLFPLEVWTDKNDKKYFKAFSSGDNHTLKQIIDDRAEAVAKENNLNVYDVVHGSPAMKQLLASRQFKKSELGKTTNANSAHMAFFAAGNIGTAAEYATMDAHQAMFGDWFAQPKNANEILSFVRDKLFGASFSGNKAILDAKVLPESLWTAYGNFVKKFLESNTAEERLDAYNNYVKDLWDVMAGDEIRNMYYAANFEDVAASTYYDIHKQDYERLSQKERKAFIGEHTDKIFETLDDDFMESDEFRALQLSEVSKDSLHRFEWSQEFTPGEAGIRNFKLFMRNPYIHDFAFKGRSTSFADVLSGIDQTIHDGVIFKNVKDGGGFDSIFAFFDPSMIKLSDPVVRDANGIIPPSQRMDLGKNDIMFRLSTEDRVATLTPEQQAEVKRQYDEAEAHYSSADFVVDLVSAEEFRRIFGDSKEKFFASRIKVVFGDTNGQDGYFDKKQKLIVLNESLNNDALVGAFRHELTHARQMLDGALPEKHYVSPAESIAAFMDYFTDPKEIEARAAQEGVSKGDTEQIIKDIQDAKSGNFAGSLKDVVGEWASVKDVKRTIPSLNYIRKHDRALAQKLSTALVKAGDNSSVALFKAMQAMKAERGGNRYEGYSDDAASIIHINSLFYTDPLITRRAHKAADSESVEFKQLYIGLKSNSDKQVNPIMVAGELNAMGFQGVDASNAATISIPLTDHNVKKMAELTSKTKHRSLLQITDSAAFLDDSQSSQPTNDAMFKLGDGSKGYFDESINDFGDLRLTYKGRDGYGSATVQNRLKLNAYEYDGKEIRIVSWNSRKKGFGRKFLNEALKIAKRENAEYISFMGPSADTIAIAQHYVDKGIFEPTDNIGLNGIPLDYKIKAYQTETALRGESDAMFKLGLDRDSIYEEFVEHQDRAYEDFLREFDKTGGKGYASWPLLDDNLVKRLWSDFAKFGFVRNERGMERVAEQMIKLIARLQTATEISGHTELDARANIEDMFERTFDDDEWEKFQDFVIRREDGTLSVTDYGLKPLIKLMEELADAKTHEDLLVTVDKMLNVVHMNGDLSKNFIRGGVSTLDYLKYQGTDNAMFKLAPETEQTDERFRKLTSDIVGKKLTQRQLDDWMRNNPLKVEELWEVMWEYLGKDGEPSYLYHGTSRRVLDSIRTNGFQPKFRERNDWEPGDRGPQEEYLLYFEKEVTGKWGKAPRTTLRIDEDGLPRHVDIREDQLRPGEFYSTNVRGDYYEISPEFIDYLDNEGNWHPLLDDGRPVNPLVLNKDGKLVTPLEWTTSENNTMFKLSDEAGDYDQSGNYVFNKDKYRPAVVKYAQDTFGDRVAPNGRKVWQNFVRWFGDSQLVDAEGKPLLIYRGEGSGEDRTVYDPRDTRESGIFMTPVKKAADVYEKGGESRVFYVRAESLLDLSRDTASARKFIAEWASNFDEWIDRQSGEEVDPVDLVQSGMLFEYEGDWSGERWKDLQSTALMEHDAVLLPDYDSMIGTFPSLVVRDGLNQIKSATGNVGDYSESTDVMFKLSDTEQMDKAYMDAVNSGDMATAQRMVDEKIQIAGYKGWGRLRTLREPSNKRSDWLSRLEAGQDLKADVGRNATFNMDGTVILYHGSSPENIASIQQTGLNRQSFLSGRKGNIAEHIHQHDKTEIIKIVADARDIEYSTGSNEFYAPDGLVAGEDGVWAAPIRVGDGGRVKLSAPVTYDEQGNVIPLSKRFDEGTDNAMFKLSDEAGDYDQSGKYIFNKDKYRPAVVKYAQDTFGDRVAPNGRKVWQNFVRKFNNTQVVDNNGAPLMVYHGTSASFSVFDRAYAIPGAYFFSDNSEDASAFSGFHLGAKVGKGANVMPVYLSLNTPKVLDMKGKLFDFDEVSNIVKDAQNDTKFDGVILRNIKNFPDAKPSTTYIAFNSEQIKSAIGNVGDFSESADVMFKMSKEDQQGVQDLKEFLDPVRKDETEFVNPETGEIVKANKEKMIAGYSDSARDRGRDGYTEVKKLTREQREQRAIERGAKIVPRGDIVTPAMQLATQKVNAPENSVESMLTDDDVTFLNMALAVAYNRANQLIKFGRIAETQAGAVHFNAEAEIVMRNIMMIDQALLKAGTLTSRALSARKGVYNKLLNVHYRIALEEKARGKQLDVMERKELERSLMEWQEKYAKLEAEVQTLEAAANEKDRMLKEQADALEEAKKAKAAKGKADADVTTLVKQAWSDVLDENPYAETEDIPALAQMVADRTGATLHQAYATAVALAEGQAFFRLGKPAGDTRITTKGKYDFLKKNANALSGSLNKQAAVIDSQKKAKRDKAVKDYEKYGNKPKGTEGHLDLSSLSKEEFDELMFRRAGRAAIREATMIAAMENINATMQQLVDRAKEILKDTEYGKLDDRTFMDIAIDYSQERPEDTRSDAAIRVSQLNSEILQYLRILDLMEGVIPHQRGRHSTPTTNELREYMRKVRKLMRSVAIPEGMKQQLIASANKSMQTRLLNTISELQEAIREKKLLSRDKKEAAEKHADTIALEKQVQELREVYNELAVVKADKVNSARQKATNRLTRWRNELAQAKQGIFKEGETRAPNAVIADINAEIEKVKLEIKELKKTDPQQVAKRIADIVDRADEKIGEINRLIEAGEARDNKPYKTDAERAEALANESEEQKARREQRARIKEALVREQESWIANNPVDNFFKQVDRKMDSLQRRIGRVSHRLTNQEFQKPEKKREIYHKDLYLVRKQLMTMQSELNEEIKAAEYRSQGVSGMVKLGMSHTNDVLRAIMASIDVSFMGIQGAVAMRSDLLFNKGQITREAWSKAWKAVQSEEYIGEVIHRLFNDPNTELFIKHGGDIGALANEIFGGNYAARFVDMMAKYPGAYAAPIRVAGQAIAASERHFIVMGAVMRAEMFKRLLSMADAANLSERELDLLANMVNVATGSAPSTAFGGAPRTLGKMMWAARLFASRVARLTGGNGLFYHVGAEQGSKRGILLNWKGFSNDYKKLVLRQHAEDFISLLVFGTILKVLLGMIWRQEHEDEDTLWRKIMMWIFAPAKIGNQQLDLTGGVWRLYAGQERMWGIKKHTYSGKPAGPRDTVGGLGRMMRGTANPLIGFALDMIGKDLLGEPYGPLAGYKGANYPFDWKASAMGTLKIPASVMPLSLQNAGEAIGEVVSEGYTWQSMLGAALSMPFVFAGTGGGGAPRSKDYSWNRHKGVMNKIAKAEKEAKKTGNYDAVKKLKAEHAWNIRNHAKMERLHNLGKKWEGKDGELSNSYYNEMEALWDERDKRWW